MLIYPLVTPLPCCTRYISEERLVTKHAKVPQAASYRMCVSFWDGKGVTVDSFAACSNGGSLSTMRSAVFNDRDHSIGRARAGCGDARAR